MDHGSIPALGGTGCAASVVPSECITHSSLHPPSLEVVAENGMHSTAVAPSIVDGGIAVRRQSVVPAGVDVVV